MERFPDIHPSFPASSWANQSLPAPSLATATPAPLADQPMCYRVPLRIMRSGLRPEPESGTTTELLPATGLLHFILHSPSASPSEDVITIRHFDTRYDGFDDLLIVRASEHRLLSIMVSFHIHKSLVPLSLMPLQTPDSSTERRMSCLDDEIETNIRLPKPSIRDCT